MDKIRKIRKSDILIIGLYIFILVMYYMSSYNEYGKYPSFSLVLVITTSILFGIRIHQYDMRK
ncbi:hypothetical protein HOD20_04825 [archaeon]|jgi:hypothetical protein|nr:hypothetical protein [archaeon]MBT4351829.1 hypothetical protein [archaeon]MBT4646721.1 hypothetical protein [archaeon]MBT6821082.1 hypothetical protein [archaeon]MBT7392075.1 hypothetical protein [archaeon]